MAGTAPTPSCRFQEFDHLFGNPLGRSRILPGDEIPVGNTERLPGCGLVEDRALFRERRLQLERHIRFRVILLFVVRERTDVLPGNQVPAVAQLDVELRDRSVADRTDHCLPLVRLLDDVLE